MAFNTQTTVNTTTNTFINKTYHDRNLLENMKTVLRHVNYGQKKTIPINSGKTVEFRGWTPFDPNDTINGLTEGVIPDGQELKQRKVNATLKQYGSYVSVADLLKHTAFDKVIEGATDELGEQIGVTIEWVTRDVMNSGTNVQYANGKVSRATLTAADKLTTVEVRKAVRTLKKAKAKQFNSNDGKARTPHFVCICSPDAVFDLQSDNVWQAANTYVDQEHLYSGEIGRIFGVVFVESTEAKVYTGAGTDGVDVHSSLIFGRDAYGIINLEGQSSKPRTIIKPLGSGGAMDPLNQLATVGAKVEAYTAAILTPLHILRVEHGVTV